MFGIATPSKHLGIDILVQSRCHVLRLGISCLMEGGEERREKEEGRIERRREEGDPADVL